MKEEYTVPADKRIVDDGCNNWNQQIQTLIWIRDECDPVQGSKTFETIMISLIVDGEERLKLIEGCPKDERVARTVMIYPRLL